MKTKGLGGVIEEKDAEIERLKKRLEDFGQKETYKEWQRNQTEIEQLKKRLALYKILMTRAADALEFWMKDLVATEQQYVDAAMRDERLLAELRKAAE
jgi:predicted RNase H-like nuclease (RuvC/YqgF family)